MGRLGGFSMASSWFETVAIAQRRAQKRLPKSVYGALVAGSEKGLSSQDNLASFDELGFAPHVAGLSNERSMATTVMGQAVSMPVLLSPTGVQAVYPDGEVAVARAASNRGVAMGLSSFASKSVEEVCAACDQVLFQMYWSGDRDTMVQRLDRAKSAGAKGIILTLDWSFSNGRDWGSPSIPERVDLRAAWNFAPDVLSHPRWLWSFAKTGHLPSLTTPNMAAPDEQPPTFFGAYYEWMQSALPSWDDVAWLREQWEGPFMVKGVSRVDDAKRVVDLGASALSVSNHGGNNLDGTPAPLRALPAVVDAVGDQIEVLLDGGVRRGSDVVKALALGANAVMIGRAYLWGLAVAGQSGVENVLDILRGGIDSALLGLGKSNIDELDRTDVLAPPDFFRKLG
jgi:pre-mycofactocin synthase